MQELTRQQIYYRKNQDAIIAKKMLKSITVTLPRIFVEELHVLADQQGISVKDLIINKFIGDIK